MSANGGIAGQNTQNGRRKQAFPGAGGACNGNDLTRIYGKMQIRYCLKIRLLQSASIHAEGNRQIADFQ